MRIIRRCGFDRREVTRGRSLDLAPVRALPYVSSGYENSPPPRHTNGPTVYDDRSLLREVGRNNRSESQCCSSVAYNRKATWRMGLARAWPRSSTPSRHCQRQSHLGEHERTRLAWRTPLPLPVGNSLTGDSCARAVIAYPQTQQRAATQKTAGFGRVVSTLLCVVIASPPTVRAVTATVAPPGCDRNHDAVALVTYQARGDHHHASPTCD
jgi:hypothetical protein